MKKVIIYTIITIVIIQLIRFIPNLTSDYKSYYIVHNLLYSGIILLYFKKLYELKVNFQTIICIAFIIPMTLYIISFIEINIQYTFFNPEAKREIENLSSLSQNPTGALAMLTEFNSPLKFSLFDCITNTVFRDLSRFYGNGQYLLLILTIMTSPIILLGFFSKYILFKRLSINPLFSLNRQASYFVLINKFSLPKEWKIYIFLPIINIYIYYKINQEIVKELEEEEKNVLGLLLLPFVYYPKLVFNKKY